MTVRILQGDCRTVMATLPEASVDAIVTDPPYHLTTGKKGGSGPASVKLDSPHGRARVGTGFMGMTWDGGDVAMRAETWAEALRVLKPGGFLVAFGGTRTYHRMACAIEDAGFEYRDMLAWLYGSGFPKSTDRKKIPPEWTGWNTALKPALEPIAMARKPMDGTLAENLRKWGTGALWIDGCRIDTDDDLNGGAYAEVGGRSTSQSLSASGMNVPGKTVGKEFEQPAGRWPANVLHDGSDEVIAAFPREAGGQDKRQGLKPGTRPGGFGNVGAERGSTTPNGRLYGDTGSAARFFYCAKADRADRNEGLGDPGPQFTSGSTLRDAERVMEARKGNHHPTVKPTDLMRWLCKLVTPRGGLVLDPFMGSGSTLKAAELEGFSAIGIELDPAYIEIAKRRIAADAPLFADVESA